MVSFTMLAPIAKRIPSSTMVTTSSMSVNPRSHRMSVVLYEHHVEGIERRPGLGEGNGDHLALGRDRRSRAARAARVVGHDHVRLAEAGEARDAIAGRVARERGIEGLVAAVLRHDVLAAL